MNIKLRLSECADAAAVQSAIDSIREPGGIIQLPELDLTLDRGLEMLSYVNWFCLRFGG